MFILDANTKSLEISLASNAATSQLPVLASYVDITNNSYSPLSFDSNTNDQSAVTIVAAPAALTQREVRLITVQNKDTANATVLIQYNNNSALRPIVKNILEPNDTLLYADGKGFSVVDARGQLKIAGTGPIGNTGTTGLTGNTGAIGSSNIQITDSVNAVTQANILSFSNTQFAVINVGSGQANVSLANAITIGNSVSVGNSTVNTSVSFKVLKIHTGVSAASNNGLEIKGAGTTRFRIAERSADNFQMRTNMPFDNSLQDNSSLAGWSLILDAPTDVFQVNRVPAGTNVYVNLLSVSNTGNVTFSNLISTPASVTTGNSTVNVAITPTSLVIGSTGSLSVGAATLSPSVLTIGQTIFNTNGVTFSNSTQITTIGEGSGISDGTGVTVSTSANTNVSWRGDSYGGVFNVQGRRASGTSASPGGLSSDDIIVQITGLPYGSTTFHASRKVGMFMKASQASTDNNSGTYISFETTPNGSNTNAESLRLWHDKTLISNAGAFAVGNTSVKTFVANSTTVFVGNSTVNATVNSSVLSVSDAIGTTIVNSTAVALGANGVVRMTGQNRMRHLNMMAKATANGSQSVANNTVSVIDFQTEVYDTDNLHSASANSRFTVPIAGKYLVGGTVRYESVGSIGAIAGNHREIRVMKNNTLITGAIVEAPPVINNETSLQITCLDSAAANDYYEIAAFHLQGANLLISSQSCGWLVYQGE